MTIYIENAIIDNMVINTLLLYFVFKTIKQPVPKWRVVISASVGTMFAILLPLLTWTGFGAFAVRMFIGASMVYIVQSKSLARFLLFYLLFLTYTFAFGGAIYGIMFMFTDSQTAMGHMQVPMGLLVAGVAVFAYIMRLLIKYLNVRHSVNNLLRDVVIYYGDEKFKITSYLDTGNRLIDPVSKAPVVIITVSLFLKMFPDVSVDRIYLNRLCKENIDDGRYINFSTVGNSSQMFVFAPQKIEIMGKQHENVRLGVTMKGFKDAIKYDALLNANLA